MKLTKSEEYKLKSEGLLVWLLCCGLLVGIFLGGNHFINKIKEEDQSIVSSTQNMMETNRRDAREIKFLRENEEAIETMWSTLKGWGTGITSSSVMPLAQAGIKEEVPLPPTRVPGNPTEYIGLKIMGDKTEFQRMLDALSVTETQEGLMQVRAAQLMLPANSLPNQARPTYLNIQLELVGPIAR
jgi:hypothetical protein